MRSVRVIVVIASLFACGPDDARPGNGTDAVANDGDALRFEQSGALRVSPAAHISLVLLGKDTAPARVWLEGDYLDGSLDRGSVDLGEGSSAIRLSVPSTPTTFAIRARQGESTTRLEINVNPSGSAVLRIHPKYDGPRAATSVVASVFVGRTCEQVTSGALVDGVTPVEGLLTSTMTIPSVPPFVALSVLARVERYAAGCVRIDPLQADSTRELDLAIYDRPLDLAASFAVDFAIEPTATEAAAWHAALAPLASSWLDAFLPPSTAEGGWLLDAMMQDLATRVSPAAANEFATKRAVGNWSSTATSWIGSHPPAVRTRASTLVDLAIAKPATPLSLAIRPGASLYNQAFVMVAALGGKPVSGAWISSSAPFDWHADAADVLSLAGGLTIEPGTLIGFGADLVAAPSADAATAIAQGIDCAGLAKALVGTGTSSSGCGLACTADLCRSALGLKSRGASVAVDAAPGVISLGLTASAKPRIGPAADVIDFTGPCFGTVTVGKSPFSLSGMLSGKPLPK